jgi:hypothetical protein
MRKIEDEQDAGQSAGEWSRAHGVDGRSLHAWQVNLARPGARPRAQEKPATRARAQLVELVPASKPTGRSGRYVIELGGARLEFDDDASAVTLRRIVEALRSC